MVTVDDGDAYTMGLTVAFANAFGALGGEVVAHRIEKLQTDMTDLLAEIAAAEPDGIYFPLFEEEGAPFVEQAKALPGLEDVTLISDSALLTAQFLSKPQSSRIYYAAPAPVDDTNVNEVTGKSRGEVSAAYRAMYGEPEVTYWPHAYDAATLLISAIESVGERRGARLYVDRAALRDAIAETQGFQGLLGTLSCDEFGDCGTGGVSIYYHTDPSITDPAELDPIYP
jgi:branched-chain amino acid transport system substrate-binding protein